MEDIKQSVKEDAIHCGFKSILESANIINIFIVLIFSYFHLVLIGDIWL